MQVNKRNIEIGTNGYLKFFFFLLRKLLFNYCTFFARANTEKGSAGGTMWSQQTPEKYS